MRHQGRFQKPYSLAHSLIQAGIVVCAFVAWRNCRDRISHEDLVAQPTPANHERGQYRRGGDLRKHEGTERKASGLRKKRHIKSVALINAVSLHRYNLIATQSL